MKDVDYRAVYIAGPMRGYPWFNFDAFYAAEQDAAQLAAGTGEHLAHVLTPSTEGETIWTTGDHAIDVTVFNPARRDHAVHGDGVNNSPTGNLDDIAAVFDLRDALATDLNWIARNATHIYMLKGWQNSKGAKAERALAQALGLTILYQDPGDPYEAVGYTTTLPTGEVRVTSLTGGEKGSKPARFDLIPAGPLTTLAKLYGKGAEKYDDRNWERGYDWSLSFAALNRHLWAFWQGEDTDPEHGLPHLASVAWHAFALMEWAQTHPEFDNRPKA